MREDKFLNFKFGAVNITQVHLNKRFERNEKDGYYNTEHSIDFSV